MKDEEEKRPITDVAGEAYEEIMEEPINLSDKVVSDCEIEQEIEILNPDPNSLDSRG